MDVRASLRTHRRGILLVLLLLAFLPIANLFGPSLAQSGGGVTEFSTFTFDKQEFKDNPGPFRDRLGLKGVFTLGPGADGIDPVAEEVKVTLTGTGGCLAFSQTIAPGAFKKVGAGFTFQGSAPGELSLIRIKPNGAAGHFSVELKGRRLQFACPLATTLAFIIGDDGGAFDFDTGTQIPLNVPPVADAGLDQTVQVGQTVTLDGSGSSDVDGDQLTFSWSLTSRPEGSAATLSDPNAIMPTFVADVAGVYVAQLIVNDGQAKSAPDTVTITTENSPPVADAGPDQTVAVGAAVQLDGGGSSDADGDALTFTWSLAGPQGSTAALSDPSVVNPSFVADVPGTYTAQLIVNDGQADSAPDEVMITTENSQPVANAGPDQTALVDETVTLDGSGSSDADNDPLTFKWSLIAKPEGSTAVLATADQVQSTLVPDLAGDYLAQLIVNDGQLDSDPDTAMVKIEVTAPTEPVISDFNPKSASIGDQVTVTGTNLLPASGCPQVTLTDQTGGTINAPIVSCSDTSIVFIVPAGAATGPITVTINGQTVPIPSPDGPAKVDVVPSSTFSLSVKPAVANVLQGESVSFDIELESTSGFTQLAALSAEGLPSGVTAEFSPSMLTAGQRGTLTLTAASTTAIGSVSATVVATAASDAGPITQSDAFTLTVQEGGHTALLGRFMLVDGTPLQGVKLSLPCEPTPCQTETDSGGNFQLVDVPAGTLTLGVDSTPVGPTFPIYGIDVTLTEGQATQLPPLEITPQPPAENFEPIQNAGADQVITDPRFPGASFTLPEGVTITGWDGALKTQMAIERLSPTMLPVPPPPGPTNSVYQPFFGTPMGGLPSAPIPVTAPNDLNLLPGEEAEIWYYDAAPFAGVPGVWRMAGMGTVSGDGSTIVSDPGVGIERFCGVCGLFCIIPQQEGQPNNIGPQAGDPVNVAIGQMITEKTDLVLPGRIPAIVHRTHNPFEPFGAIAGFELSLGPGWALSVEVVLQEETSTLRRLILPGNARFAFPQKPGETSFVNTTHPRFAGAVLTSDADGGHTLRFKDGTTWGFDPSTSVAGLELLAEQIDRNGNRLTIERDSNNKITRIIEPAGRELVFTIASGRITEVRDPLGRTVKYGYDSAKRLETVTDPAGGVTRYAYDSSGRILTITDPKGIEFLKNEYSPVSGRILKQTQADGGVWLFRNLVFPNVECPTGTICDPALVEESSETVAAGLTGPLANVAISTTVVDPQGNETIYAGLGSDGFEDQITDALGQTTSFERDPQGQVTAVTDPLGRVTRFEYDTAGNVTRITDPEGNVRLFEYEPSFNRLTKITDPLGNITTFEYDAKGNLIAITDPEQNLKPEAERLKTRIAYTEFGQPTSITDALGNVTGFAYDAQGNLTSVADPLNNTTRRAYDLVSRLASETDARGATTKFEYDALNQITQIVDALNGITGFSYDPNGNLLTVTDARGNATEYTYEDMDRLATRKDPVGASESFDYDQAGNLTQHTDRKGQLSTFSYDQLNRPVGASFADGTTTNFVYDAVGRLVQASDSAAGDILSAYDILDRLTEETTALGTIQYGYDDLNRRTSMSVSGQAPVSYNYDANSRLQQIVQDGKVVDFNYDALDRPTNLRLPNEVSTEYSYDTVSRLTELIYRNATADLGSLTYQYDAAGNRTQVGGSFARTLLPDAVASSNYDAADRQLEFGGKTMTFDENGNLKSITEAGAATNFSWDARNRLVALSHPGTDAAFAYDTVGRRIANETNGQRTEHLYDGLDIIQESRNGTAFNYLRSLGIDEALVRNGTEHYLADALGSSVALTDSTGAVQTEYSYEPFGKTVGGAANENPFQYTGRENDGTGLYYYRARYYSPKLQRFISEDPLELAGRDPHLYTYAANDPIGRTDLLGLRSRRPRRSAAIENTLIANWLGGLIQYQSDTLESILSFREVSNRVSAIYGAQEQIPCNTTVEALVVTDPISRNVTVVLPIGGTAAAVIHNGGLVVEPIHIVGTKPSKEALDALARIFESSFPELYGPGGIFAIPTDLKAGTGAQAGHVNGGVGGRSCSLSGRK